MKPWQVVSLIVLALAVAAVAYGVTLVPGGFGAPAFSKIHRDEGTESDASGESQDF